jgi:hypothetical protein
VTRARDALLIRGTDGVPVDGLRRHRRGLEETMNSRLRDLATWLAIAGTLLTLCGAAAASDDDFRARCSAPQVMRCFGFDAQSEIQGGYGDPFGILEGWTTPPALDTAQKASGASSLKFTIPSHSPESVGSFFTNFSNDLSLQFGEGQEFYVQWRQRFSTEFLNTWYNGGGGWKHAIIGEGDRPGVVAPSCTQIEVVVQNTSQRGLPQVYHSCGAKDGHYEGLEEPAPGNQWNVQNMMPSPYCLTPSGWDNGFQHCFKYAPNEWMTFQIRIKVGHWYLNDGNYHQDSIVELWVARQGQPSTKVLSFTRYDLANNNPSARYGKLFLLPFHTGKDPNQAHPTAYTWYDELIISRTRIPDPGGSGLQPPAAPGNLSVK